MFVTALAEARGALANLAGQRVGLDIETTGLDPLTARARLLQVATAGAPAIVVDLDRVGGLAALKSEIEQLRPVCHNALFELGFLRKAGICTLPDCTLLANHCIAGQRESLEDVAGRVLGRQLDKTLQKSNWSGELSAEQLQYAATDAEVTVELWNALEQTIEDQHLGLVYRLQRNAQPAITVMHLAGMPFDATEHAALVARLTEKRDALLAELKATTGVSNPNSGPQLGAWLQTALPDTALRTWPRTNTGRLATSLEALGERQDDLPSIVSELLVPYKLISKQVSSFGARLLGKLHPLTGRIHGSFHIAGAVTGRMSCSNPNLQQIPRGPDFRVLFRAPSGRALVVADYSQIELRVAAIEAREETLLAGYERGIDAHTMTTAMLLRKRVEEVTKSERYLAKAVNFGLLYGQGAEGLRNYARRSYGVKLTLQEAAAHRAAWHRAYPAFGRWHKQVAAETAHSLAIETSAGRWRWWRPGTLRATQAFNTPIQGGAAEIMLAALGELMRNLPPSGLDAVPIAVVHDELILETAEADAPAAVELLTRSMEAGARVVFPEICTRGLVEPAIVSAWSEK
jgi:DNA polymerase-1